MRFLLVIAIVCATLLGALPGHAEKRAALVIGNAAYQQGGQLPNPVNDATAVAALFKNSGFDVVETRRDLGIVAMRRTLGDFADLVRDSDIAVVYFAGHGIEVDGINYLIPTDAVLARDFDVEDETLSLDRVLKAIEPARRLRLVILDACRNNPFADRMKRSNRAIGRGFARVEPAAPDTLVAFAAKAGSVAADGRGEHSPFTAALLKHLPTPGLDIRLALGEVRDTVMASTSPRQEPFVYGSLGGRPIAIVEGTTAPMAGQVWAVTQNTTSIAVLEDFIRQFGDTPFGSLARARREELIKAQGGGQVAVVGRPELPPADPCTGAVTVSFPSRCAAPLTAAQERGLKPKDSFQECEKCPEMVMVPKGSFTMGSRENEPGRDKEGDKNESPQHVVKIDQPFAAGRLHVTRGEFAAFVAETKHDAGSKCSWRNPGFAQEDSHPAVCLSWNDAKAYVDWLAKKTGKPYRLLTEAEWEYAARAQTSPGNNYPRFWFGNDEKDLCRYGNGADQTARDTVDGAKGWTIAPCSDGYAYTSPAGHFPANDFGLHDMFGNAWQWTADCSNDSYKGAPTDGSAWTAENCSRRVVRGGSWDGYLRFLRVANRSWYTTDYRDNDTGLRVGRTLTP